MTAMQGALSAAERSMRSVFVGNIPYEATEEQLKDIFSEVGPVVSFRLVYDRETGKPKGYGFCEYKDQETALSAMRNLNGYELNGRALRVDNAASEKSKEELKNLQASLGGPPIESPYGSETAPEKAPEEISKAVASLPPEQMFELMKQMKMCIENNPNEARNLLLQNPQLAYALLQAQVIMRIVDPQVAMGMLHRPTGVSLNPGAMPQQDMKTDPPPMIPAVNEMHPGMVHAATIPPPMPAPPPLSGGAVMATRPAMPPQPLPQQVQVRPQLVDPRAVPTDRDMRQPMVIDHDMRPPPMLVSDKDMRGIGDQDLRNMPPAPPVMQDNRRFDPRFQRQAGPGAGSTTPAVQQGPVTTDLNNRGPPVQVPFDRPQMGPNFDPRTPFDIRSSGPPNPPRMEDPRTAQVAAVNNIQTGPRMPTNPRVAAVNTGMSSGSPVISTASPNPMASPRQSSALAAAAAAIAPHDQEKAALIMQVLQLSDQQIAMLPPEQRQSIMVLKEQIARSQQA